MPLFFETLWNHHQRTYKKLRIQGFPGSFCPVGSMYHGKPQPLFARGYNLHIFRAMFHGFGGYKNQPNVGKSTDFDLIKDITQLARSRSTSNISWPERKSLFPTWSSLDYDQKTRNINTWQHGMATVPSRFRQGTSPPWNRWSLLPSEHYLDICKVGGVFGWKFWAEIMEKLRVKWVFFGQTSSEVAIFRGCFGPKKLLTLRKNGHLLEG